MIKVFFFFFHLHIEDVQILCIRREKTTGILVHVNMSGFIGEEAWN